MLTTCFLVCHEVCVVNNILADSEVLQSSDERESV